MTYGYRCDGLCDGGWTDDYPAISAELSEYLFKTSVIGDDLKALEYSEGDKITLCEDCLLELLME